MRKIRVFAWAAALALALTACGEKAVEQALPEAPMPTESITIEYREDPAFYRTVPEDVNPYTGLQKDADYPQGTRGVAVMINNVQAALPQSGLNGADLVYEMVTESGITRLMAVYRDYTSMPTVGPIRSARDQHVQLMLPLNCLYAHIGGSNYANDMLEVYKYTGSRAIDGKYKTYYWIDSERRAQKAQEHCVFTNGENMEEAVERYGLDDALGEEPAPVFNWGSYAEPARELTGGPATDVYVRFSGYAYSEFVYNADTDTYTKYEFGGPELDMADGTAYNMDNVLVLFTKMEKYPDGVLTQVYLEQGAGLYFCGGRYEKVRWIKGSGEAPLRILDAEGHETDVVINPGRSYIALVDDTQIENMHINQQSLEQLGL